MATQAVSVSFSAEQAKAVTWSDTTITPNLLTGTVLTGGNPPASAPWFDTVTSTGGNLNFPADFTGTVTVVVVF